MHTQRKFMFGVVLLTLAASMLACKAVSLPMGASASTPGLGVPVSDGKWEVTLSNPREEMQLQGSSGNTYTPNSGYTFLVIDAAFRNLDPSQKTFISGDAIALSDSSGEIFVSVGSGFGTFYSLGGTTTYSNDESDTMTLTLVFSVSKANISQEYKFQFMDVPKIPFTMNAK